MTEIVVRDATAADAPAIGLAHVLAWQHAYRGVMPDEYLDGLRVDDRVGMWRDALSAEGPPAMLVVTVDDEPAGFAVFGEARESGRDGGVDGELYAINLHPEHWGKGAGRTLLRAATERLATMGFAEAVLWVVPENARARALYESEGWVDDDALVTEDVLGVTVADMRYRRRLG